MVGDGGERCINKLVSLVVLGCNKCKEDKWVVGKDGGGGVLRFDLIGMVKEVFFWGWGLSWLERWGGSYVEIRRKSILDRRYSGFKGRVMRMSLVCLKG